MFSSIDWEEFPKTYNWKDAISFIREKNISRNDVKEVLQILINEGNTVEDEALTVAVLEHCLEDEKCSIEEITNKYGKNVACAVQQITLRKEETYEKYIERIFNEEKFKYTRKIVVANLLYNLRKNKRTEELILKAKKVLQYEQYTNRELIRKLNEEVSDNKVGG